jgi:hypothetical protein
MMPQTNNCYQSLPPQYGRNQRNAPNLPPTKRPGNKSPYFHGGAGFDPSTTFYQAIVGVSVSISVSGFDTKRRKFRPAFVESSIDFDRWEFTALHMSSSGTEN